MSEIPKKDVGFSPLIPGNGNTYIYKTEEDYCKHYQRSYFAITYKKGGWDSLPHYEIIACGCIPSFVELD